MLLNNYRDIESDLRSNKKTIPNLLGHNKTRVLIIFVSLFPLILNNILGLLHEIPFLFLTSIMIFPTLNLIKFIIKTEISEKLNKGLLKISLLNFGWCLLTMIFLCLS